MDFIEKDQTFIVELGFLGVHSDEDHQREVNIYNAISDFVDYTTWRISVWLVLLSERCTQSITWCAFSVKLF